jgi:hypothetical protein
MRPEAVVDLIDFDKCAGHPGRTPEKRPKLDCFSFRKISHCCDMSLGFDDQGAQAQGTNAVFNQPKPGPVDEAAG